MSRMDEAASVADERTAFGSLVVVAVSVLVDVSLMTELSPRVIPDSVALAEGLGVIVAPVPGPVVPVSVVVPVVSVPVAVASVAVVVSPVMTEATSDRTSPIVEMTLPRPESALLEESVEVLLSPVTCRLTARGK
jgi:hypothetical protein